MINHSYPGYNAVTVFLHLSAQFPAGNGALCGASSEVQPGGVPGCGALNPRLIWGIPTYYLFPLINGTAPVPQLES